MKNLYLICCLIKWNHLIGSSVYCIDSSRKLLQVTVNSVLISFVFIHLESAVLWIFSYANVKCSVMSGLVQQNFIHIWFVRQFSYAEDFAGMSVIRSLLVKAAYNTWQYYSGINNSLCSIKNRYENDEYRFIITVRHIQQIHNYIVHNFNYIQLQS
jgi:hypothetical protein